MEIEKEPVTITEIEDDLLNGKQMELMPARPAPPPSIIEDEVLLDVYQEILQMCRDDRRECDQYITNFAELVINEGDSTTASKEALVNLMKVKSDIPDKMSKIASEMTRLKLKETVPVKVNTAKQENVTVNIGDTTGSKRALIELIENMTKKHEEEVKPKVAASAESKEKKKKEDNR